MQCELLNCCELAKTQRYLLKNYLSKENEPWCYHTQFSYHLQVKNLSMPLFHKAVRSIIERHPVLKTVFLFAAAEIKQALNPKLSFNIVFQDVSNLSLTEQTNWVQQFLLTDRNTPFDVYNPNQPLFKTYIIKRSNESLQFILVFNHAIWDGWSLAVLMKEIFAHYQALKLKPTLNLQLAEYDYPDFIKYEQGLDNSLEAKEFWDNHLKNHQSFTSEKKQATCNYNNYRPVEKKLSAELTTALLRAQLRLKVTMKALFIAQFIRMVEDETMLAYNTIGIVTNGRSVQLKNPLTTLGLLWNMAPLCVELLPDYLRHINNVNQALANVALYGSYSLMNILEAQNKDELFHAAFNFINFGGANLLSADSDVDFLEVEGLDKFHYPLHLLVGINPFNKDISLVLNYDTRCYSEQEIENKLDAYIKGLIRIINIS